MKLTGAQIVIECLKEQQVTTIFGYPGAANIDIYDELFKNEQYMKHILVSHEQGATHMADGYARSSGKVGVCMATSGPGATNLVTGLATAYMDSSPIVAITGNVVLAKLGKDSFQEVDIQGITMPITKHNYMVKDVNKLAKVIREAFYIAREGRPGPVLIDIPKDILTHYAEYEPQTIDFNANREMSIDNHKIAQSVEMIKAAKRPFIYVGGGVIRSQAYDEVLELVKRMDAPVATSLMGISAVPSKHPHFIGMMGMHGSMVASQSIVRTDLLIAIGVRFSDRVAFGGNEFAKQAKVIHIDIDPAEINKNKVVDLAMIGSIPNILSEILKQLPQESHEEWMQEIQGLREQYPMEPDVTNVNVPHVLRKINHLLDTTEGFKDNYFVATDVGQHQMWSAQYYQFSRPRTWLTSGGLGTMGFGIGAAIGAVVAHPGAKAINITGDGCFRMNMNEILTGVKNRIPMMVIVMNNNKLGMVRQWQDLFYEERFSGTDLGEDMDYVMFAKSQGANGFNINEVDEIEPILKEALQVMEKTSRPVVVNCRINPSDIVFPMVPPGKNIQDAIIKRS